MGTKRVLAKASKPVDFETVRRIGKALADTEESTMYGSPALKLGKRMLACIATNKAAEPGTLVIRTDFESRDELIATAPDVYYLKEHYKTFPVVLVRMSRIHEDALRDLLGAAWKIVTAAGARKLDGPKRL